MKNLQSFLQSCNKSLINQACSRPYWENIGRQADILPVRPSRLVNKIYIMPQEGKVYLLVLQPVVSLSYYFYFCFCFCSPKFSRKLYYITHLSDLSEHVHLDQIDIPEQVKE